VDAAFARHRMMLPVPIRQARSCRGRPRRGVPSWIIAAEEGLQQRFRIGPESFERRRQQHDPLPGIWIAESPERLLSVNEWPTSEHLRHWVIRFRHLPTRMRRSSVKLWSAASARTCHSLDAKPPGSDAPNCWSKRPSA